MYDSPANFENLRFLSSTPYFKGGGFSYSQDLSDYVNTLSWPGFMRDDIYSCGSHLHHEAGAKVIAEKSRKSLEFLKSLR